MRKRKVFFTGSALAALVGTVVWFNTGNKLEQITAEKADQLCAKYCSIHKAHRLIPTGKEIGGKQHVECECLTEDRGWKRNRTNMKLTK